MQRFILSIKLWNFVLLFRQCCGSDPGSGSCIRDGKVPDHIFENFQLSILGLKNLNSLIQIPILDPGSFQPWILDKHPGSALLVFADYFFSFFPLYLGLIFKGACCLLYWFLRECLNISRLFYRTFTVLIFHHWSNNYRLNCSTKAMGVVSDQEIVQMVGTEDKIMTKFSASLGKGDERMFNNKNVVRYSRQR